MMQFVQEFTKVLCCADRATQNGTEQARPARPKQFNLHGAEDDQIVKQEKAMQDSLGSGFPSSPCSQREPAPEPTPVPSLAASESPSMSLGAGLVMGSSPNVGGFDEHGFEDESPSLSVQLNIVAPTNEKLEHPILENKKSIVKSKEEKEAKGQEKEKMNDVVKAAVQAAAPAAPATVAKPTPQPVAAPEPMPEVQVILSPSSGSMIAATGNVGMQMLVL